MKRIKAGIIGGAGYTGGELIRILLHHPDVEITLIHSRSNGGRPVASVHQDLLGETALSFDEEIATDLDVLFLCVGHGEARTFLEQNRIPAQVRIIDLSQDFRLAANSRFEDREFVYGLPELNKEAIRTARHIANPGCFATAIQLGLLPLAAHGFLDEVHITGITGSTGAGQSLSATSHFSWRTNNIQAYKTLTHQHLKEISQSLRQFGQESIEINFIPWRGDFSRGIFVSATITSDQKEEDLAALYLDYYREHPFTLLSQGEIYLKQVLNTNKCVIQLEKVGTKLVIHSAIDNLIKGASGQAVQNMNLMFGLEEKAGLGLKTIAF